MMADHRPLTILVVTYNSRNQIIDCLKPFGDRPDDIRVRVRDNGSNDATPAILEGLRRDGYIDTLILSDVDAGFAIACNDVIQHSEGDDILLLNPDARADVATIRTLQDAVRRDPTVGAASPVVHGGAEISVMSAGRQPRLWPMFTHYSGLSRAFPRSGLLRGRHLFLRHHADVDQFVEWTSGCCLFVPRATIDRVGMFTEQWFLYMEDTEYCKRITDAGLTVKVLAAAQAFHEVGGSSSSPPEMEELPAAYQPATADPSAEPIDIGTMWGRHLYQYYAQEFRPNPVTRLIWRLVFTFGNAARALIRRSRYPGDAKAKHLMKNALAIWR